MELTEWGRVKDESHISGLNSANDQSGKNRQKHGGEGTLGGGEWKAGNN